jgi:hypothetical protein
MEEIIAHAVVGLFRFRSTFRTDNRGQRERQSNGAAGEVAAAGGVSGARTGPVRLATHHLHRLCLL